MTTEAKRAELRRIAAESKRKDIAEKAAMWALADANHLDEALAYLKETK